MSIRRRNLIILATAAALLLVWLAHSRWKQPPPIPTATDQEEATNRSAAATDSPRQAIFHTGRTNMTEAQAAAFKMTFDARLKPAIERWCQNYGSHVPFQADAITPDKLYGTIGRGTGYCVYTFMLDGMTVSVEDANGVAKFLYLNTPETRKLLQLPRGTPPDVTTPVTREEVSQMLRDDAGSNFPPAQIRITPTALSSAMNGGAKVEVGGDPNNAASWKFNMTFGPNGTLNYYLRGY